MDILPYQVLGYYYEICALVLQNVNTLSTHILNEHYALFSLTLSIYTFFKRRDVSKKVNAFKTRAHLSSYLGVYRCKKVAEWILLSEEKWCDIFKVYCLPIKLLNRKCKTLGNPILFDTDNALNHFL